MSRPLLTDVLALIQNEVDRAEAKFAPFNSSHEGWAVIREEVDELWEAVKENRGRSYAAYREAVQVAAMAIRYIRDVTPPDVFAEALNKADQP